MVNKIEVNEFKSAVLELKVDQRTPSRHMIWDFHEIPLVRSYKYLGVTLTDDLKF